MYHKWKSYNVWFLRYRARQTEFFVILDHFSNEKDSWRYYHFTHVYHIWHPYDVWFLLWIWSVTDMEHDRQNFLSFWAIFCTFTSLKPWKIKISNKWNRSMKLSSFHASAPNIMIICHTVPEIWCMMAVIFIFILGYFLPFYPLLTQKSKKNFKKIKIAWRCYFTYLHSSSEMVHNNWINRQTDGRMEKVTYRGRCPTLKVRLRTLISYPYRKCLFSLQYLSDWCLHGIHV